jgi:Protein of unknown function (DUF2845)
MSRLLLALGLALAAAAPAYAFRCGTRLITEGATRSEVAAKCGDPTEIDRRGSILRRPLVWIHGRPVTLGDSVVEIPVEIWIYNLGPNKLMRKLRFEDGVLVDIDTLGYGYYESSPPPGAHSRHEDDQ